MNSRHNPWLAGTPHNSTNIRRMLWLCLMLSCGSGAAQGATVQDTAAVQSAAAQLLLIPHSSGQQPVQSLRNRLTARQQAMEASHANQAYNYGQQGQATPVQPSQAIQAQQVQPGMQHGQQVGQQAMTAQPTQGAQPVVIMTGAASQQAGALESMPAATEPVAQPSAEGAIVGAPVVTVPAQATPEPAAPVVQFDNYLISLEQQTQSYPNDINAWMNFGNALLDYGYFEQSRDAFLEATKLNYQYPEAHFGLGVAEFGRADIDNAYFAFSEMERLFPERFDGHYNSAVALATLKRHDEAIAAFERAIEEAEPEASKEDIIDAYRGMATQYRILENYESMATAFDMALELEPDDIELRYLRGVAYYEAGKGIEVLDDLIALESSTNNYLYSSLIADIYLAAEQIEYAQLSLKRARMRASQAGNSAAEAGVLIKMGLLEQELGNAIAALNNFQTATQVDPSSWEAFYNLGVTYLDAGQTSDALGALQRAQQQNEEVPEVQLALATVYDRLNMVDEAYASAERAIASFPEDSPFVVDAEFLLARALYNRGNYEQARELMEGIVEEKAGDAEVQLWAGLIEYQFEEYDAALQYYERAVFLDPENIEARVNLGAAYLAAQRYLDAELVYRLIVEENGGDGESYYNLGWALLLQRNFDDAEEAWTTAYNEFSYAPAATQLAEFF